eukprot:scaffold163707_cov49-Attheya_sp.AAC.2
MDMCRKDRTNAPHSVSFLQQCYSTSDLSNTTERFNLQPVAEPNHPIRIKRCRFRPRFKSHGRGEFVDGLVVVVGAACAIRGCWVNIW